MNLENLENISEYAIKLQQLLEASENGEEIDYNSIYEEFGLNIEELEQDMLN